MKKLMSILSLFFALGLFVTSCGEATKAAEQAANTATEAANTVADKTANVADATKEMVKEVTTAGLKIGDKAPDFNLKDVDGNMVSLSAMKDVKGYIVTFTCNTCPYAVMYEDRLIDLHKTFAPQGYPVVAINPNDPSVKEGDSYKAMKIRSTEKDFPFDYLFDEGQKVYPKYGATKTPHVFILDKDLTVKYIGAIDDNAQDAGAVKVKYAADAIANIEAGKNPDPATTKAVGCSIKTKKKKMM